MASVAVSRRVGKVVGYPPPARRLVEVMDVFAGRDAAEARAEASSADRRARLEERQRLGRWAANGSDG
jgi:hypothetical protein